MNHHHLRKYNLRIRNELFVQFSTPAFSPSCSQKDRPFVASRLFVYGSDFKLLPCPTKIYASYHFQVQISFQVVQLHFCSDDRYNVQLIISLLLQPRQHPASQSAKLSHKASVDVCRSRLVGTVSTALHWA